MAEIPVQKKSGMSSWMWLLIILVLVGLIWLLFNMFNQPEPAERESVTPPAAAIVDPATPTSPAAPVAETSPVGSPTTASSTENGTAAVTDGVDADGSDVISDAGVFASTADKLSLVGRQVALDDARVNRVVGPKMFTVGSGSDEMFVMVDQDLSLGVGTQGQIDEGNVINLKGTFQRLKEDEISNLSDRRFRDLTEQERATLRKTQVYLRATEFSKIS